MSFADRIIKIINFRISWRQCMHMHSVGNLKNFDAFSKILGVLNYKQYMLY